MPTSLGAGCGRAEGRLKKCRPLPMVTLIMSKFSLVGAESKLVKLGKLLSDVEPMKGPRLDAARRASLEGPSERHLHSITSSASDSRLSEILTPSALAVLMLITSSNLVVGGDSGPMQQRHTLGCAGSGCAPLFAT